MILIAIFENYIKSNLVIDIYYKIAWRVHLDM